MDVKIPLLEVKRFEHRFPFDGKTVQAVERCQFYAERRRDPGVVGESGCGKSTLLLSLLRLIRHPGKVESGAIRFRGRRPSAR
jgi:ABC-type glutathione transport system ATPase component